MEVLSFLIANYLIFLSLLGLGSLCFKITRDPDIFFVFLTGYFLLGLFSILINFFYPINFTISLFSLSFGCLIFLINKKKILYKYNIKILSVLFILFTLIILAKTNHAIDANMYHNPFVAGLNSEKIIFGLSNIQFRFGHISFLQYVQAISTFGAHAPYNLVTPNLLIYSFFLYFCFNKFLEYKKNDIYLFILSGLTIFVLVKFSRYREFGNDLSAFIISMYFFLNILEYVLNNKIKNYFLVWSPLIILIIFSHKISYVFVGLLYLILMNKINIKKQIKNITFMLVSFLFLFSWFGKNIAHTSCFFYPIETTCIKKTEWYPKGLADPVNAGWLTELWAKDFINKENWKEINLSEYMKGFNWVETWFSNHFLKILEKVSPLLIFSLIILLTSMKNNNLKKRYSYFVNKNFTYLYFLNFLGLFIWFYNAPLFRYGASYVVSFFLLSFVPIIIYFSNFFENKGFRTKLKILISLALCFFILKNTLRIWQSENNLLPLTYLEKEKFDEYGNKELVILRPKPGVGLCYYAHKFCSHETPLNIRIEKKYGFNFIK